MQTAGRLGVGDAAESSSKKSEVHNAGAEQTVRSKVSKEAGGSG